MTYTDTMGYAVSTMSSEALAAYEQGVSLWLRQRSGAVDALTHAVAVDPHFALAHCTRAYVAWRMGQVETALAAHQQAMTLADDVHEEREHLHLQTVDAMRSCNGAAALHHLEAIADRYPADRMAMRVLSFNYIARGDYQSGVTQARHSLAACPDDPQFLTMAAFFLEQSNEDPDEALDLWSGCAVCLRAKRVGSGPLWGRICLRVKWPASAAISKRRFVSWPQRCSASTKWEGGVESKRTFFKTCCWSYTVALATSTT
jgi:tetratricopeptide (TPR) repeat protein